MMKYLALALLATLSLAAHAQEQQKKKVNVLWICLDAARAKNFQCLGYDRPTTPFMDSLARDGVLFFNHFAQAGGTPPSVSSYMSGRYFPVFALGYGRWPELTRIPPEGDQMFPAIMAENGYNTAMIHGHPFITGDSRLSKSFQEVHFLEPTRDRGMDYASFDQLNSVAFNWLENKGDEPFFLYVHALDTHWPHFVPPPFDEWIDHAYEAGERFRGIPRGEVTEQDREYIRGLYDGSLSYADNCVKGLINKLMKLGLLENTLIVINSDHGEALGEDGASLAHADDFHFDEVFHIPFIMRGPGLPANRHVPHITQNADIVPTLISYLGLETTAKTDGADLMPTILDRQAPPPHEFVFIKLRGAGGENDVEPRYVLRSKNLKYIYDPVKKLEVLYRAPDALGARALVKNPEPAQLEPFQKALQEQLVPLWKEYDALPRSTPANAFYESIAPQNVSPAEAVIPRKMKDEEDNKWSVANRFLASCSFLEDSPEVTVRFDVPDGEYEILLDVYNQAKYRTRPASSFRIVSVQGIAYDKIMTSDPRKDSYIPLGRHKVEGGFELVLDEGERTHWAAARGVRFVPVAEDGTVTVQEEDVEQLRALGYLE